MIWIGLTFCVLNYLGLGWNLAAGDFTIVLLNGGAAISLHWLLIKHWLRQ